MRTALFILLASAANLAAPPAFTERDWFDTQVAQCVEDHHDRGPLAPDINTTISDGENPESYCLRAIASGCSDPDDYSYATECR